MITTSCVLLVNTVEEAGCKRKAAFSFKYLFVYSFRVKSIKELFTQVGAAVFHAAANLDEKCVEFSSELNGTLLRFLR